MSVTDIKYINIVVEDILSEVLLKKVIERVAAAHDVAERYSSQKKSWHEKKISKNNSITNEEKHLVVYNTFRRGGSGYIKKNLKGFNNGAKVHPFIVLVDLDRIECPPALIKEWITFSTNDGFFFRVVVREIESWIMADRISFADYISISPEKIPLNIESIEDPKSFLLKLVKDSGNREVKNDMLPGKGSTAKIGPLYNESLAGFIREYWCLEQASKNSRSLERLILRLTELGK